MEIKSSLEAINCGVFNFDSCKMCELKAFIAYNVNPIVNFTSHYDNSLGSAVDNILLDSLQDENLYGANSLCVVGL